MIYFSNIRHALNITLLIGNIAWSIPRSYRLLAGMVDCPNADHFTLRRHFRSKVLRLPQVPSILSLHLDSPLSHITLTSRASLQSLNLINPLNNFTLPYALPFYNLLDNYHLTINPFASQYYISL